MEPKIGLVYFGPDESADMCMKGLFDRLKVAKALGITFPPDMVPAASQ